VTRVARLLIALSLLSAACTLDSGEGFASMRPGTLEVVFAPGRARDLGEGAFLTDQGYRVMLRTARLEVAELALLELQGSSAGGGGSFDPANPPAGYSLCHGGHCHAANGALVSYEEIQAMLAGGTARFESLVTVPVSRELDVLEGERVVLDEFLPSPELPQAAIDRIELVVGRLVLRGEIEGGDLEEAVALEVDLAIAEPLAATLSSRIDRDGPEEIALEVELGVDATMFDDIDLASLVEDGGVVIDDESPVAAALTEWLLRAELTTAL
jgi:hypothetical protein